MRLKAPMITLSPAFRRRAPAILTGVIAGTNGGVILTALTTTIPASPACAAGRCYNIDACSPDLLCRRHGSSSSNVVPARELLYQSGTRHPVTCVRIYYTTTDCTGPYERDDYPSDSCGERWIVEEGEAGQSGILE